MLWIEGATLASGLVALVTLVGKLIHLIAAIQTLILKIEAMDQQLADQQGQIRGLADHLTLMDHRLYQLEDQKGR